MNKDQGIGAVLLVASIAGIVVYTWLIISYTIVILHYSVIAVAAMLVIAGWIGLTMATTPPLAPLEPEPATTSVSMIWGRLE
jgi:predicted DNA-binding transcriptional regulator